MNPRIIVLIVLAVIVAGITAFLARTFLLQSSPQPSQTEVQEGAQVLVASKNLPMGHIIEQGDFAWASWPQKNLNGNFLTKENFSPKDLMGNVVRYGIAAGEPVTAGRIIAPGEKGFLAAVLTPGMRAVTISVSRTTGLAGFVFPGDRVDLILTQTISVEEPDFKKAGVNATKTTDHGSSVTFLRNVRVLGVDLRTDDQNKTPKLGKSVTLEVTPKMAEQVTLAEKMGKISLALRSITSQLNGQIVAMTPDQEGPSAFPETHTWDFNVNKLVSPIITPDNVNTLLVGKGNQTQLLITGGEYFDHNSLGGGGETDRGDNQ